MIWRRTNGARPHPTLKSCQPSTTDRRRMGTATFEINITADGRLLCVTIKLPPNLDSQALGALFARLHGVMDELDSSPEPITPEEFLEGWTCLGAGESCRLSLRRPYTEPDYPHRFEQALRRMSLSARALH